MAYIRIAYAATATTQTLSKKENSCMFSINRKSSQVRGLTLLTIVPALFFIFVPFNVQCANNKHLSLSLSLFSLSPLYTNRQLYLALTANLLLSRNKRPAH